MAGDHHLSAAELGLGSNLPADDAQSSRLFRRRVCLMGEGNRLERRHVGPLIVGFVHFDVSMMAWVMMGALGVFIARDLRLGPAQSALLVAVPALVGALARVPVGVLASRYGCRSLGFLTLSCSVTALALAAAAGDSYPRLLAISALLGMSGASLAVSMPLASSWFPNHRKGVALGVVGAGNSGTAIATLVAPRLAMIPGLGWHGAFACAVLPVLAAALVWFLLGHEMPRSSRQHRLPWRAPDLYALMCVYAITASGTVGLASFLPIYLHDRYGLAAEAAGAAATLIILAANVVRPFGGRLADHIGGQRLLAGLLTVAVGALLVVALLPAGLAATLPVVVLTLLMSALCVGASVTMQLVPLCFEREVAAVTGAVGAAGGLGGFVVPAMLGSMKALTGTYATGLEVFAALVAVVWLTVVVIYGRRWRQRDLGSHVTRRAGRDQSRAPHGPHHPSDGQRSPHIDRADGLDQDSSRQLSRTVGSAPARRRGRGDVPPSPAVSTGRAGPSRQGKWLKLLDSTTRLRWSGCIVAIALLTACGAAPDRPESVPSAAGAVRGFPTFPGATWDGDITSQEGDGQLVWVVSWTAPSAEAQVRRFFVRILSPSGWQFGRGESVHELTLRREDPKLRGYLRFGQPKAGETGTGVTLGIRDPRPRKNRCLEALSWLPQYPGAEVRGCDLVHVPGSRSLCVLAATGDDVALANKILGRTLSSLGWTSEPAILGVLVFRHQGGARETARVIWGPDPSGRLPTAFMLSIDLPEAAMSELPQ